MAKQEITYLIIFGSLVFILLLVFMVTILFTYFKKNQAYHKNLLEFEFQKNQELLKTRLEMQEHILNDISQEIHDNVGQELSLTKMQLNIIETEIPGNQVLHGAMESLGKAVTSLRDIAKSLSTERAVYFSLHENIADEINRIRRSGVLQIHFNVEGKEKHVKEEKKLILFRMIQECMQNIIKHSRATESILFFLYGESEFRVSISDNGKGFDVPDTLTIKSGLGLANIINRAGLIGGRAEIVSTIDSGTIINIYIPYA
jgi:signal transduction histidine kinase